MIQHTPPAATYCYENLGERHIRLLKLLVSSNADPTYNLIETSLDSAPPYETVSYVWGREQDRSQALTFASSQTVHVTPTLQHTLSHLYSRCQTGYLWLDQICIDQSNILECNQQVGLMGEVYSKAQRVLIWLGEGDEDSQHLSTLLDITSTSIQQQHSFNHRRLSIRKLLALPWFGRAWVVQEAVL
ncbi:HET-domain-containing protein, partial [Lojkania enalia]